MKKSRTNWEFESYRDVHPSILTDAAWTVTVDGTGPYKGAAGIRRMALEDYISRLRKRDEKAVRLCRLLRDRIEVLEDAIDPLYANIINALVVLERDIF